jgi:UDP-N-acetylmuramoylalanine--D-glutamate ligase
MRFRPSVGVLLNITPNHQDWHKDMAEYAAAKLRLFQNQVPADHAFIRRKDQAALFQNYPFHGRVHYLDENAANPNHDAVRQVTALFGVSAKQADEVFAGFRGIEHRMEDVGTLNGVSFINDSKATTAASLAWALEKCRDHSVLLIAGGIAKSRDFGDIKDLVARKAKKVLILGKAVPVLREAWEGAAPLQEARSLDEAVREASREAKAGDTVLLSPACSSFDMFQNYEHRGREFKRCVAELFSRSEPPKVRI